jgi:hypothetical protein
MFWNSFSAYLCHIFSRAEILCQSNEYFNLCAGHGLCNPGGSGPGGGDLHRLLPCTRLCLHGHHAPRLHGHLRCCQHHGLKGKHSHFFFGSRSTEPSSNEKFPQDFHSCVKSFALWCCHLSSVSTTFCILNFSLKVKEQA